MAKARKPDSADPMSAANADGPATALDVHPASKPRPAPKKPAPPVVDEPELDDPELDGARTERVDLLAPYYAGPRLGLKPLYEALLAAARGLGEGVKIDLSTSVIVLRRQKDFASFVASPQGDRIYVGLVLPGRPPTHRLGRARDMGWGTRFTHMVMLRYKTDVDHEVRGWLTEASLTA